MPMTTGSIDSPAFSVALARSRVQVQVNHAQLGWRASVASETGRLGRSFASQQCTEP